ncbi:MAG: glycosyltransferase family 39 protein [Candidatus Omnitrophica bacterium]|nr:glycosyltransferase family 39 protein [Candidatus Omnitrophota bacterium]
MKRFRIPLIVTLISAYAFYLRLVHLAGHDLWVDELYQISQMNGTFFQMVQGLTRSEYCAYLSADYYLTYPFYKIFSMNKWGLAIPHMGATLLGFYLLYLICRRYLKSVLGYVVTFSIVCFNATLIWHATEIRTYAVLPTVALASLYLWLRIIDANGYLSMGKKVVAGVVFVFILWFHVYGIVMFFFTGLYALLTRVKDKSFFIILKNVAPFVLVVLCLAAPLWLLSTFGPHLANPTSNNDTFQFIPSPSRDMIGFLKGVFGNLIGDKRLYFLLLGGVAPFVIPYRQRFHQIIFLIVLVVVPVGTILSGNILTHYWFLQRGFIWVMPIFALFIGWSLESFVLYVKDKCQSSGQRIARNSDLRIE